MRQLIGSIIIVLLLLILYGGYQWYQGANFSDTKPDLQNGEVNIEELYDSNFEDRNVTEYNLTAEQVSWAINSDTTIEAWTYNGTVPGEPLRVKEGDVLKVNLQNDLDVPVTIHWHGLILPNVMDGVPDLTQEAVQPGETFTYEFIANHPGTYWYHSHQDSALQVDKGLYGSLVIEEKKSERNNENEEILILDEWSTDGERESVTNMPGMMMGSMSGDGEADTKQMYDTYTVNGKSGESIKPIIIKGGEKSLLRVINAGYQIHRLKFPENVAKVIAFDAAKTIDKNNQVNVIEIAPGERVDIEIENKFTEPWYIEDVSETGNGDQSNVSIPVVIDEKVDFNKVYQDKSDKNLKADVDVDGASIGSEVLLFDKTPKNPDVDYTMDLNMGMQMGEGMVFQINNEIYPDTPPIEVVEGDIVKVTLTNNGRLNHPMHLHGHRFQVVSKNGQLYDEPMLKDLINVEPGETYEIYFKADNKGEWLFHCHDNNHADRGMITVVDYQSVYSPFVN
ncbi:multicopper oxidase family protein [Gracilibacillus massiliensis]|uniref:multicopper oxidase family protein n=1 Tax=Gracilibacillus massiliensis TaxID=1564956 RepID=UPI00071C4A2C|nr:multicopper oxidase family protein [Gracilibacillus massiliensis]